MRLRHSHRVRDPEKNGRTSHEHSGFISRCISTLFGQDGMRKPAEGFKSDRGSRPDSYPEPTPYSEAESDQASAKLWSIYIGEADRYDTALVESWKADMEGMLIFSGLFSASLTAFLIESYQTLRPDSGDMATQLLAQISQQLVAISNNTVFTPPPEVDFKATRTSLVCNTLWFLSLLLSITCALLATLVEQWAREFIHKTQKRPSPVRRARVLSFLYFGVRRFGMHFVVDLIPMLLHISLMLFLGGLIAFLLPINRVMMGLISSFLALFCAVYGMLTILPIISPDCPYRTPFSTLAWTLLRSMQEHPSVFNRLAPSNPRSMYDTMVDVALRMAKSRDQRALAWTLDSLTDNDELLPFLDAIPDAVHGITGFHPSNHHLFKPLLLPSSNQLSLGQRITDMILSCHKMAREDLLCQQRLVASMRAIWALGMISDNWDSVDEAAGVYWFEDRTLKALQEPVGWKAFWPHSYKHAAGVAILYSHMNNMRNYIAYLIRLADDNEHSKLAKGIAHLIKDAEEFDDFSTQFQSRRTGLRAHFDPTDVQKIADNRLALQLLSDDEIWEEAAVSISSYFLLDALYLIHSGETLPHRLMESCLKIVPRIPTYQNHPHPTHCMRRVHIFEPVRAQLFDPRRHKAVASKISPLDNIMKYFLRLLPLLRREDVVHKFAVYLARHADLAALDFATEHCYLPALLDALVAALVLSSQADAMDVLHAIRAVMLLPRFLLALCSWNDRDEQLWHYLTEHVPEQTQFLSISALMTHRKLHQLYLSSRLMISERLEGEADSAADTGMQRLASHPLLSAWVADSVHSESRTAATYWEPHWVKSAMIVAFTVFLSASIQSERSVQISDTANAICECLADSFEDVDVTVMADFAHSWLDLVNHLLAHPGDPELLETVTTVFLWIDGPVSAFYNPITASIFEEALTLFLQFLQDQAERDESTIGETKNALELLVARMTVDGVFSSAQNVTQAA